MGDILLGSCPNLPQPFDLPPFYLLLSFFSQDFVAVLGIIIKSPQSKSNSVSTVTGEKISFFFRDQELCYYLGFFF